MENIAHTWCCLLPFRWPAGRAFREVLSFLVGYATINKDVARVLFGAGGKRGRPAGKCWRSFGAYLALMQPKTGYFFSSLLVRKNAGNHRKHWVFFTARFSSTCFVRQFVISRSPVRVRPPAPKSTDFREEIGTFSLEMCWKRVGQPVGQPPTHQPTHNAKVAEISAWTKENAAGVSRSASFPLCRSHCL